MDSLLSPMAKRGQKKRQKSRLFSFLATASLLWALWLIFHLHPAITGSVVVSGGSTVSAGNQQVADPQFGVVKGILDFTLADSSAVVGLSYGNNYTLYFSRHNITNYTLLRQSLTSFNGNLTGIDGDGASARCSAVNYTTVILYYDENNNNNEESSEKDAYAVTTDVQGCFAAKVKAGNNNIYG